MELQVGVKILLQNKEGKYLLLRRSPLKYPEAANQWDIVGGRIIPGIPLLDNLKREVKEEIGLDLKENVELIAAQDILRVPGRHVVRLTYIGKIEGTPYIDEGHLEFKWFTIDELEQMRNHGLDRYFQEVLDAGIIGKI